MKKMEKIERMFIVGYISYLRAMWNNDELETAHQSGIVSASWSCLETFGYDESDYRSLMGEVNYRLQN